MAMKKLKIVLDTSIWISQLFGGNVKFNFYKIISSNKIQVYVSKELIFEIFDVVERPKIRKMLKDIKVQDLSIILNRRTKTINPTSNINICRDPKDNFLLSLCHDCNADYLITGDKDLLVLKSHGKTKILNLSDFITTNYL